MFAQQKKPGGDILPGCRFGGVEFYLFLTNRFFKLVLPRAVGVTSNGKAMELMCSVAFPF